MTGVYVKGEGICIQRDRAEGHMKTEAGDWSYVATGYRIPEATSSWSRQRRILL